jgi:hypothetical protein
MLIWFSWIRFAYSKARRAPLFELDQWRFGVRKRKQKLREAYCSDWIAFVGRLQLTWSAILFGIVLGAVLCSRAYFILSL